MRSFKHDQRFAQSTKGRIVQLLRGSEKTVAEIVDALSLTGNAVRVHLADLERDGIVEQSGVRQGFRKPHVTYCLTEEAEKSFAQAYEPILGILIDVLELELPATQVEKMMREVGHRLAQERENLKAGTTQERLDRAIKLVEALGGSTRTEEEAGVITIYGASCPLRSVVARHHQACLVAETLLQEIIGVKVTQKCEYSPNPHCCFTVELGA